MSVLTGCRLAYCGDGVLNTNSEECDGRDFGQHSCASHGHGWPTFRSLWCRIY